MSNTDLDLDKLHAEATQCRKEQCYVLAEPDTQIALIELARRASPQPVAVDEYKVTERLLNRSAFISGLTYEMYEAEVSDLHSTIVRLRAALEDIAQPADAGCGCSFPCRCNTPEAEAINAEAMRDIASAALTHHPSVPVQEQSDKVDERVDPFAGLPVFGTAKIAVGHPDILTGEFIRLSDARIALDYARAALAQQSCPPVQADTQQQEHAKCLSCGKGVPEINNCEDARFCNIAMVADPIPAHPAQDGEGRPPVQAGAPDNVDWITEQIRLAHADPASRSRANLVMDVEHLLGHIALLRSAHPAQDGEDARDAKRYRWLRNKANDERGRAPMVFNCHPEDSISWTDSLHGANLDAVLDVFIEKSAATQQGGSNG